MKLRYSAGSAFGGSSLVRMALSCASLYASKKTGIGVRTPAADRKASHPGVATRTVPTLRPVSSESFMSAGRSCCSPFQSSRRVASSMTR